MEGNEVVILNLDLDVKEAKEGLEDIQNGLTSLKGLAKDISKSIGNALVPMHQNLQKMTNSVYTMTDALAAATSTLQALMKQMAQEQTEDLWASGISTVVEGLSLVSGLPRCLGVFGRRYRTCSTTLV